MGGYGKMALLAPMVYTKGVYYLWEVIGVTNMGSDHRYGK